MLNTSYSVKYERIVNAALGNGSESGWSYREMVVRDSQKATTQFVLAQYTNQAASGTSTLASWEIKGFAA